MERIEPEGLRAGISGARCSTHSCRHSYTTNLLNQKCGDVFRLQQILVYSTLEMGYRYVHFTSAQDMMQGCVSSPVDRLGIKKLSGLPGGPPVE